MTLDELIIIKAKNEGRLIILPCKIGDTVYGFGEKYGYTCIAPLCISGFSSCNSMNGCYSRKFIVKEHKFNLNMFEDFNKTIFLTEQEASIALSNII